MAVYRSGVYEIKNSINGNRYIGSSVNMPDRFFRHKDGLARNSHYNAYLQNAWNKYGAENFKIQPILYCDPEMTLLYEQLCLDNLNPEYNIAKNAMASATGLPKSQEHKRKISESNKGKQSGKNHPLYGKHHSEETKQKISKAHQGIERGSPSKEHREKISEALRGRVISPEWRQKISEAHTGRERKPFSDEWKKSISESLKGRVSPNKGKKLSTEHKQKISESLKGRKPSKETLVRMSEGQKMRQVRIRGEIS